MSKSGSLTCLLLLGLLVLASLSQAARPAPAGANPTQRQQQQQQLGAAEEPTQAEVDGCGDDCVMRRTLEAHLDYIYTQEKKN